ncbi:MAG TPA: molybdopterin molybdotransferase MoeA [Solimonas sp.]|nr:molybdopterin molybdotransferase MoeA [Solimonas sp.]
MIPFDKALAAYPRALAPQEIERVPLAQALHRVLREPLLALDDLPRHSQSALDGYVLTAADAARAPCPLRLAGEIPAGLTGALPELRDGECLRILTGARVPVNAGAVIAQERTETVDRTIFVREALAPRANIRWQGEERRRGELLAPAGIRLRPGHLSAAAAAGHARLGVSRAPRIAVLVSGDELRPAGTPLEEGQIWDSNGPLVAAWLAARGYTAQVQSLADSREAVDAALDVALAQHDLVITTGGVSVGDRDYVLPAAEALGVRREFWGVAQKPGKPLYFGTRDGRALLGLPGNPAAVLVGLYLHVRAALDVLEGADAPGARWQRGRLTAPLKADAKRDRLVRMACADDDEGRVLLTPLPHQDSHMLSNLLSADALAHLPARDALFEAGEVVRWVALD